jgi:hypothetical protein
VQNIYRGWALFGIVLFGALIAKLVLAILLRGRGTPFVFALFCFLLHRALARHFLRLDLPGQSGDRQLGHHPRELGTIAMAVGIFSRRQCPDHFRGILLGHAVRVGDAGMNAVESIGHEWMRPNTTSVMLYKSISHRNPQWRKRNDGAAFLRVGNRLVSVRKHFESFESFVIQQW